MNNEIKTSWVRDDNLFFNLSPAKLTKALEAVFDNSGLSPAQQLFAQALMQDVAKVSVPIMEEKARMEGGMPVRMLLPAHSLATMAPTEGHMYDLVRNGDIENVKGLVQNEQMTLTAHPNFMRSRALVAKSRAIISALCDLSRQDVQKIAENGQVPEAIADMLSEIKPLLAPRVKRTRYDELQETTLDVIPVVFEAARRQVDLIKKRMEATGDPMEFTAVNQLKAMAKLLPEYATWFPDGDGKRTCHVYDSEVAVPAIKRGTFEEYVKILDRLPPAVGNFSSAAWKRRLEGRIKLQGEVETIAARRMEAFNSLHEAYAERSSDYSDEDNRDTFVNVREAAQQISLAYMTKLKSTVKDGHEMHKVSDILRDDLAAKMKADLEETLQGIYAEEAKRKATEKRRSTDISSVSEPEMQDSAKRISPDVKAELELLFMDLERYGNFSIREQRRENAAQYREIFEYLVQRPDLKLAETIKKSLGNGVQNDDIGARLEDGRHPDFYEAAVRAVAASAMDPSNPSVREHIYDVYKGLSHKLEKNLENPDGGYVVMRPLEYRELLTLDGLGHFNMAALYPEAFSAGFVIAEFAQPGRKLLKGGTPEDVEQDVVRRALTDMHLQLIFAHSMGAPEVAIIPLHEDPSTMTHIPAAQGALRQGLVLEHSKQHAGADTPEGAQRATARILNAKGEPAPLTAYTHLRSMGVTDKIMKAEGLGIEELKKTHVIFSSHGMEACSDISKRAGTIGAKLAQHSIQRKNIEAAKHPTVIGDQAYIFVEEIFLGQGGKDDRATNVPTHVRQKTVQGEHLNNMTADGVAIDALNRTLARLRRRQEAAQEQEPVEVTENRRRMREKVSGGGVYHAANLRGDPTHALSDSQRELMQRPIDMRIDSTRDDPRYNKFLEKYGEPVPNYSARPGNKGGGKQSVSFDAGRAIGIAGNERVSPNILANVEIFEFTGRGRHAGKPNPDVVREVKEWINEDPDMQHLMLTGALAVKQFETIGAEQWKKGGVTFQEQGGAITLRKGAVTVPLEALEAAYKDKNTHEYKAGGETFDAADLVFAHITHQYQKFGRGLKALDPGARTLIELFHPEHRETIEQHMQLQNTILKAAHAPGNSKDDQAILEGLYYLMTESGPGLHQTPGLFNERLYRSDIQR